MRSPHFFLVLRRPTRPLQRRWFGRCSNGPGRRFEGLDLEKQKNSGVTLSAEKIFEVRFVGCNFLCWNRGCWMVGWFPGEWAHMHHMHSQGFCFWRKIRIANVEIVNLHQLVLLTHLCLSRLKAKHLEMQALCPKRWFHQWLTNWPNEPTNFLSTIVNSPQFRYFR